MDKLRVETIRFKKSLAENATLDESRSKLTTPPSSADKRLSVDDEARDFLHREFVFQRQLQTQIVSEGKQSEWLSDNFQSLFEENNTLISESIRSQKSSLMEKLFTRRSHNETAPSEFRTSLSQ